MARAKELSKAVWLGGSSDSPDCSTVGSTETRPQLTILFALDLAGWWFGGSLFPPREVGPSGLLIRWKGQGRPAFYVVVMLSSPDTAANRLPPCWPQKIWMHLGA